MGYYNDVAIGMSKEDGERFLLEYKAVTTSIAWLYDSMQVRRYPDCLVVNWVDVKWYDEWPEVQWVYRFMQELEDNDRPVSYIRIGEALDDCEAWSSNDYDNILRNRFWLNRSITLAPVRHDCVDG